MFGLIARWFKRVRKLNVNVGGFGGGVELEPPTGTASAADSIRSIKLVGDMTVKEGPEDGIGNLWHFSVEVHVDHVDIKGSIIWTFVECPLHPRLKDVGKTWEPEEVKGFVEVRSAHDLTVTLRGDELSWTMHLIVRGSAFDGTYKDQKHAGTAHGGAKLICSE